MLYCFPVSTEGSCIVDEFSISNIKKDFDVSYFVETCKAFKLNPDLMNDLNKNTKLYRFMNFIHQVILNGIDKVSTNPYEEYDSVIIPIECALFSKNKMRYVITEAFKMLDNNHKVLKFVTYLPFFTDLVTELVIESGKFEQSFVVQLKEIEKQNLLKVIVEGSKMKISRESFLKRVLDTGSKPIIFSALDRLLDVFLSKPINFLEECEEPKNYVFDRILCQKNHPLYKEVVLYMLKSFSDNFKNFSIKLINSAKNSETWTKRMENIVYYLFTLKFYTILFVKSIQWEKLDFFSKVNLILAISECKSFKNVKFDHVVNFENDDQKDFLKSLCKKIFSDYSDEVVSNETYTIYLTSFYYNFCRKLNVIGIRDNKTVILRNNFNNNVLKIFSQAKNESLEKAKEIEAEKTKEMLKSIGF